MPQTSGTKKQAERSTISVKIPEGKFYGGAELLKKKSKIRQNCWTRKVELVINNQIQATILIGYPLVIL